MSEFDDALAGLSVGGEIIADSDGVDPATGIVLEEADLAEPANVSKNSTANDDDDSNEKFESDQREMLDNMRGEIEPGNGQDPNSAGDNGELEVDLDKMSESKEILEDVLPVGKQAGELSYLEIQQIKSDLLFKIRSLEEAGYQSSRTYSSEDSLVELQLELRRLQEMEDLSYGLKMARGILTHGCSLIETINESSGVSPLKLKGFSAAVRRDTDAKHYDSALTELSQKYLWTMRMSPEMKLFIGLSTSAVNCHLTNSIIDSTKEYEAQANNNSNIGNVGKGSNRGGGLQSNLYGLASSVMKGKGAEKRGGGENVEVLEQPQMSGPKLV